MNSPSRATCWIVSAWKTAASWASAPEGKILKTDVAVAKNYLTKDELDSLGRIVNAYLELAEDRAHRKIPMSMEDWSKRLDAFLEFDEREVLQNSGKISAKLAQTHAESEFEKYRIVQDRLFESDFDKAVKKLAASEPNTRDDG
nr:RhuM family protein [Advenella faeciporci]